MLGWSHGERSARFGSVVVLAFGLWAPAASAQPSARIDDARRAFDEGSAEHARGQFAAAATSFARADEIIPSDEALEASISSATRADDAVLAMQLVDRSSRSTPGKRLAEAVRVATERFRGKLGRVVVGCSGACSVSVDGRTIATGAPEWSLAGRHTIVATREGAREERSVDVAAGVATELTMSPAPAPAPALVPPSPAAPVVARRSAGAPAARAEGSSGLSSTWVWVGAGATAVLGAASVVSGLDAVARNDEFKSAGCATAGSPACDGMASAGESAQLRTNVLFAGTGLIAIATGALAAFFVDWRPRSSPSAALHLSVGPTSIGLTRAWP